MPYLYYGNPSATGASNEDATFIFFDNFAGTTINSSKWTVYNAGGSISQNNKLIFVPKSAASSWTNTAVVSKNRANNANTYFTNFRVRKYAYPEPV